MPAHRQASMFSFDAAHCVQALVQSAELANFGQLQEIQFTQLLEVEAVKFICCDQASKQN